MREADHSVLGGGVDSGVGGRTKAQHRRHVDDDASAALDHRRQRGLRGGDDSPDVGGDQLVDFFFRRLVEAPHPAEACVVDQHVDAFVVAHGGCDEGARFGALSHV